MKYEESYAGLNASVLDIIKKAVPYAFIEKLEESGVKFGFPEDSELDYKVKYVTEEEGGSCTLKVTWDAPGADDEEDDEEKEDENED